MAQYSNSQSLSDFYMIWSQTNNMLQKQFSMLKSQLRTGKSRYFAEQSWNLSPLNNTQLFVTKKAKTYFLSLFSHK